MCMGMDVCVCVCMCVRMCDCVRSSACRCLCARFHDSVTLVLRLRVTKSYRLGQCPIEKYLVNDPSFAVVSSGPLEHLHLDKRHVHTAFTDEQLLCTTVLCVCACVCARMFICVCVSAHVFALEVCRVV